MKTFFSISLFATVLVSPFVLRAGDNEQKIEAPITSVVVYLTGVEIAHEKTATLQPGRNELHFVGLTSKLIPKSIQFTATGEVAVLAISNRIDYIYGQKKNDARLTQLNDSLEMLNDAYAVTQGQVEAYQKEKLMLDANRAIGGNNTGVSPADLKLTADFYVTRTTEINTELVKLNRKAAKQQEIIDRLTYQVNEANQRTNPPMGEIIVLVNVTSAVKIESTLNLNYVASDAGWAPSYDLICEDVGKNIDLKYRAKVFNNTNVDWKDVKMKLSTANPMKSAAAPTLEKWTLNFDNDLTFSSNRAYEQGYISNDQSAGQSLESQNLANSAPAPATINSGGAGAYQWSLNNDYQKTQQEIKAPVQYNQIQVSELSADFEIKSPYDIPADGKPYIVDVTSYNLPATFQYHCVPKMEKEAFLMARITGWEDLDLVEGQANVYFGGTYVGQSYIYTRSVDDTLDLSFGRDQKLVVTRTKLKEFNNEKASATTKKETYSYEIVVKNTRKTDVVVELQDQVPVSQDAEIIVESSEISKGDLDPATGIITWNMTIKPGEQQKVTLTYSVKYPKNKTVKTRKYKSVAAPSF
ncbi:MAG TPA: DUF4139 domain-containing protein [Bacteroidia bacterium]|nr:DUF4139 domain-containing protein [Bacteroidia bacterium]